MESSRGTKIFWAIVCMVIVVLLIRNYNQYVPAYSMDDMQLKIKIDKNKNCTIQEHFKATIHGNVEDIYHTLPIFEILTDTNGKKIAKYNRIIETSFDEYDEKRGCGVGNRNIRMYVWKDSPVREDKEFDFSYVMNTSEINSKEDSSVLLNLVSTDNKVQINGITFSVELPTEIQEENVHFYLVNQEKKMTEIKPEYNVSKKTLTGNYPITIKPQNGFVIKVSGQNGTFYTTMTKNDKLCISLTIMLGIAAFLIWFFLGREKYPVIETVEFSPPFDLNCLEVSWIYKGEIAYQDVLAMFLYMAGKGYIRAEKRYSYQKRKNEYVFFFEKNYDGDNLIEEKFMSIMYSGNRRVVYEESLKVGDGGCLDQFMGWVNEVYREEEIFSNGCCIGKWLIILINVILFVVNFIIYFDSIINGSLYYYVQMLMQLYGAGSLLLAVLYIPSIIRGKKGGLLRVTANSIVAAALISWFPLFVYGTISQFIFRVIMPIGVIILVSWFYRHMNRRNEQATVLMGRILGYRKFLQHVEKSRIEILMNDHPDLFFTVFSYTYVLNVSWEWLLDLEDIVFPVREKNELY